MNTNYTTWITNIADNYDELYFSDTDDALDFLFNPNNFRPFHKGLTEFIQRTGYRDIPDDATAKTDYLMKKLRSIHSTIERKTVASWFSTEHRPKIENSSRAHMYEIGFALNASLEDMNWFSSHVYLSRCFNCHRIDEAVYYYCFSHKLSFETAKELIDKVTSAPASVQGDHAPLDTQRIQNDLSRLSSIDELVDYLITNKKSFDTWNLGASSQIDALYKMLINKDDPIQQDAWKNLKQNWKSKYETNNTGQTSYYHYKEQIDQCGLLLRYYFSNETHAEYFAFDMYERFKEGKNPSPFSVAFLLNTLLYSDTGLLKKNKAERETLKKLKEKIKTFPQEPEHLRILKESFPDKKHFSNILDKTKIQTSVSYEAIRRTLILLASYVFWYNFIFNPEKYKSEDQFEIYCDEINTRLETAGYPPLFYGNPYDLIFMIAAKDERPVEYFSIFCQDLLDKFREQWEEKIHPES